MSTNLMADVWEIQAVDDAGTDWAGSTMRVTSQTPQDDGTGYDVAGFFEWIGENGSYGRETFEGTLSEAGIIALQGLEVVSPSFTIITTDYFATLTENGQFLPDGAWEGGSGAPSNSGIPADFTARRELEGFARVLVDFEHLTGDTTPADGMKISDQYLAEAGLVFSTLDGQPATIAMVGGPATAFDGVGADTPAASRADEVGTYFLTDDGTLDGEAGGLRIDLESPAAEIRGGLIDVDGNESWDIFAFDAQGNVVASRTIDADDPFTGNGIVTYFVLETDNKANEIVSVVVTGDQSSGEFGFGLDTLAIEFATADDGGLPVQRARDVAYLYEAGLDRDGEIDGAGLNFWIDQRAGGLPAVEISQYFLDSDEFEAAFGDPEGLSDRELVEVLYRNVLDREGEQAGVDFWTGIAEDPEFSRADLLLAFARSDENVAGSTFVETLTQIGAGEWDFLA